MNNTNDLSWATQVAQFRFALIAPVVQGLFPDALRFLMALLFSTVIRP